MKTSVAPVLFTSILLNITACSGPYDPAGLGNTIADSRCRFIYDCCSAAERFTFGFFSVNASIAENKDECIAETRKFHGAYLTALEESRIEGRIEWDSAAAESCFGDAVAAADECNAELFYAADLGCDSNDFAIGLVESGDPCYESYECATDGAVCEIERVTDDGDNIYTAKGKCVDPLVAGDSCSTSTTGCAPGLYCDFLEDECTAYSSVGGDCSVGACDLSEAYCSFNAAEFRCRALKSGGDDCDDDLQCRSYICYLGTCDSETGVNDDTSYEMCIGEPL
ncbi:MAG: hypothetical protein GY822_25080 [Deltaproteobacteria bacterium]|nr:hypothetical protein [Deltaproteobacteria bacterium]